MAAAGLTIEIEAPCDLVEEKAHAIRVFIFEDDDVAELRQLSSPCPKSVADAAARLSATTCLETIEAVRDSIYGGRRFPPFAEEVGDETHNRLVVSAQQQRKEREREHARRERTNPSNWPKSVDSLLTDRFERLTGERVTLDVSSTRASAVIGIDPRRSYTFKPESHWKSDAHEAHDVDHDLNARCYHWKDLERLHEILPSRVMVGALAYVEHNFGAGWRIHPHQRYRRRIT